MRNKINTQTLTMIAFGMSLNVVGAFIAYTLKLPIYIDSIGTILIASILGPKYAVITGVLGSLVSGMTFDIYSIYFAPVQISTGLISGIMFNKGMLSGYKLPIGVLCFVIPTSFFSAIISSQLFGGVTSAGSSYIVQILSSLGVYEVLSIFTTQFFTDYADKFIAVLIINSFVKNIPYEVKHRLGSK